MAQYPPRTQMAPTQQQPQAAPVNYFAKFIEDNQLIVQASYSELISKKIGIDGNKIIDVVNACAGSQEKFHALSMAFPYQLYQEIYGFTSKLQKWKLHTHCVFNGMMTQMDPIDREPLKSKGLQNALMNITGGRQSMPTVRGLAATAGLEELSATLDEDGENYLFSYVKQDHVIPSTCRAPYWAWAQLASYFAPSNKYLDEVFGCYELLAFRGIHRVIVKLEDEHFFYVEKSAVLRKMVELAASHGKPELQLTEADLAFFVAASSNHKLFNDPPVVPVMPIDNLVHLAIRLANGGISFNSLSPSAVKRVRLNAAAVEYCPVITANADCVPLCHLYDKKPSKTLLKQIFGTPLPALYYFCLMHGLLTPTVLSTVATRQIIDTPPAIDCTEFRQTAEYIIPLRTQIVYQLVQSLDNEVKHEFHILWIRRYNQHESRRIPILQPPQIKLDEWNTHSFQPAGQSPSFFTDVLNLSSQAVQSETYSSVNEAVAAVLLKSLDLLGYFTHATQANSQEVSGPSVYSSALQKCETPSLSEYAVLLIELLRTRTLTDRPMTLMLNRPAPNVDHVAVFASRLLTILPINLSGPWTGPINPDLAAFVAMGRCLQRTLRSLTEVIAVNLVFDRSCTVPSNRFVPEVMRRLPFQHPPAAHAGLLIQYILENEHAVSYQSIQQTFPECAQLENDLSYIFCFWFYAYNIVSVLHSDDREAMNPTYQLMNEAHRRIAAVAQRIHPQRFSYLSAS